ncbi:MAG: bifunctional phosphoglucose/phosphomannose isomerase [Nanoarchaeota archaeon]
MPTNLPNLPAGDMLALIKDLPYQARESLTIGAEIVIRDPIENILITGMGGSAIAGSVLQSICYNDKIPITVCRGMALPGWAGEKTLVIVISYSGDTDETLSMYTDATRKKCKILAVASGGKLARLAKQDGLPLVTVPRGLPPRGALGYLLIPMLAILCRSHLVDEDHLDGFDHVVGVLERAAYSTSAQNLAKRIGKSIPLIYSTPRLEGVGLRWKTVLNENSKVPAFANTMPEVAHNEILTFGNTKIPFHAVMLRDERDTLQMKRRIEALKTLLRAKGVQVTDIEIKGTSNLSKIMSAVHLGDFVSYYLAEENGVDPLSVRTIDEYKAMVRKAEGTK